jgi:C1A family cysteine protease
MPTKSPIIDDSQDPGINRQPAQTNTRVQKVNPSKNIDNVESRFSSYMFNVKKDKADSRDYIFKAFPLRGAPKSVDLRKYCGLVEDQGALGSCTAQATSSAMEMLLSKLNKSVEVSRLFIYYNTRLLEGTVNQDSGAYLRDAVKAANKWGAAEEKLWPYNARKYAVKPDLASYGDANKYKLTTYSRCLNLQAVKNSLALGNPVVAGLLLFSSFLSKYTETTGIVAYPNVKREYLLGGHAVVIVGYDDATQRVIAKNSWGPGWGDRGYMYIPYPFMDNPTLAQDMWSISGITQ